MIRYDWVKRSLDILISAVLIVLLSPVLAITAICVYWKLGTPIIFRQRRPGLRGEVFTLLKFRTMREPSPGAGEEEDADRMTDFGRRLRSLSLDELPSLVNVLRGDMSLVGPRPLLVEYLELYTSDQARRHEVRPGITGLAQVNGRNHLDWNSRFALDVEYVDTRSFSLDSRIIMRTISAALRREGISQEGHVTMKPFEGSDPSEEGHL